MKLVNILSRPITPRLTLGVLLPAGLFLASCQIPQSQRAEATIQIPEGWQNAPARPLDTASLGHWWQRFRDPVLNQLIAQAKAGSPDMRTALSRVEESRAQYQVERTSLFPTLDGGGSARLGRRDSRSSGVSNSQSYDAALSASWEADLFGRKGLRLRSSAAEMAQAEENYYAAQVILTAEVAEAYIALRLNETQLSIAENSLKTREETTQITQWREQAGNSTALDSLQAETTLQQARSSIPSLRQSISQSRNRLALLCGQAPGGLDRLLGQKRSLPAVPGRLASGIPADTLRQRPDVRAAERGVAAAVARTQLAERAHLPSLGLSGSLGVDALRAGRLFSPETIAGSLGGSLSAPIFDAGRLRQNVIIQGEQEKRAFIAYESTVLTALSEVENALVAIQRTNERLSTLANATRAAQEAANLAQLQYQAGEVNITTVLDTQRTLLSLEEQQASTKANEINAHIQLYKALGGGWSAR